MVKATSKVCILPQRSRRSFTTRASPSTSTMMLHAYKNDAVINYYLQSYLGTGCRQNLMSFITLLPFPLIWMQLSARSSPIIGLGQQSSRRSNLIFQGQPSAAIPRRCQNIKQLNQACQSNAVACCVQGHRATMAPLREGA